MSRFLSEKLSALTPYTPGEQPRGGQYVQLDTNESPFPPSPKVVVAAARDAQRLRLAEEWMRRQIHARAPARALADYLGVSPMGLQRLFRDAVGLSPGEAFRQTKMREAAAMLKRPGVSVKETAFMLGYRHPGDFTRAFVKFHGKAPGDFRGSA